ncbi:trehalase-like domain-containing protein [Streptomyces sp. NPDC056188]|uniref:trehalase-like domain-containing protein n=1 Tax=Streptomyces sp. NPDC056188 TaxID=3345740 RepID=UPI0035DA34BB
MNSSGGVPAPHTLRDYALLADGERGALVGPRGDIVWMCAPAWDSDAVFTALIGGPGWYTVTPAEPFVHGGYYEQGGLIWRSRWITTGGIVECREALALPGDPHRVTVLRRVMAVDGDARVGVRLYPAAGFGRRPLSEPHRDEEGRWTGRAGELYVRFTGAPGAEPAGPDHPGLHAELRLAAGTQDPDAAPRSAFDRRKRQRNSPPVAAEGVRCRPGPAGRSGRGRSPPSVKRRTPTVSAGTWCPPRGWSTIR